MQDWREAKAMKKEATAREESAKATVLAALGDAELGTNSKGDELVTYFMQDRKAYEVAATEFRVLREKKKKV